MKSTGSALVPVGVVVVHYRCLGTIRRCLDSLRAQSRRPDRVVLVDNSGDRECETLASDYPDVEIVFNEQNVGFAAANNQGLAQCETEFVALLNPDAFPEPPWLEALLAAAAVRPDCAAFGSLQLMDENPERIDGMGDIYHLSGAMWREAHGCLLKNVGKLQARSIFSPCAAAALYRRAAVLAAGGFDESFFCYAEDVDLGFRLRLAGWDAILVPDAVVRHAGSASSGGQRAPFASYHGHRNMVWVFVKNMPGALFWMLLPCHLLMNLWAMVVLGLRGQAGLAWKAKRDAIRCLPAMWTKRKKIQTLRKIPDRRIWRAIRW